MPFNYGQTARLFLAWHLGGPRVPGTPGVRRRRKTRPRQLASAGWVGHPQSILKTKAEFQESLAGTELESRPIAALEIPEEDTLAFAVQIEASAVLAMWQVARPLAAASGRWPVVVTTWDRPTGDLKADLESEDLFSRFYYEESSSDVDVSPKAIIRRAEVTSPDAWLRVAQEADPEAVESVDPTELRASSDEHLEWFQPTGPTALLFLPTPHSWESLAFLHWYAAVGSDSEPLIALLRRWNERWGAELVAHFGTMLQFVVSRPPLTESEAAVLAKEQILAAPCTTILPGIPFQEHARVLIGRDRWLLHERP